MRTYTFMYLAIAQLAAGPLLSLLWPAFRARYLSNSRWLLAQLALTALAFVALAVAPR